ncbi:MAG: YggS family pyridoxal phosphate-dependent enzyme [Planctomycetota bacterium]
MEAIGTLEERYTEIKERIGAAAARIGRSGDDIILVAVGKYADVEDIRRLAAMGHQDFGESRVQQLVQRASMIAELAMRKERMPGTAAASDGALLPSHEVRWHMIGNLQRNKARKLVNVARLVHSIDSLKLADELQQAAIKHDVEVEVLVQVNCTDEPQKGGCAVAAAPHLAAQIDDMFPLRVRGFMTMGPTSRDEDETRSAFGRCQELFEETSKFGLCDGRFNILSMGMSEDYELAIECGANVVRVGSALFGEREDVDGDELEDGEE